MTIIHLEKFLAKWGILKSFIRNKLLEISLDIIVRYCENDV